MSPNPEGARLRRHLAVPAAFAAVLVGLGNPVPSSSSRAPAGTTSADTLEARLVGVREPSPVTVTFPTPEDPDRPLMVLDGRLEERVVEMAARSRRWREGLNTLRGNRFPVLVGSIVQVEEHLPTLRRIGYDGPAAAWIFTRGDDRPVAAAVTINLPKLVIRNRVLGGDAARLERMLDLHLAHEVYGHLVPIVESGGLDHPCYSDPDADAPPDVQMRSCVMRRESRLLEDLGYEPRESYRWDYWDEAVVPADQ